MRPFNDLLSAQKIITKEAKKITSLSDSNSLGAVTLPLSLGAIAATATNVEGSLDPAAGTQAGVSTSTVGPINLLGGVITADQVQATATAVGPPITSGGSATFTNLRILGVPFSVNPGPNTNVTLPLLGSVTLNEQVVKPSGILVNALHVRLLGGTDLVVARAAAHLVNSGAVRPVP
jgi:hypothetical protein